MRKAWFCDYATWRLEFFSTWLNNFMKYRDGCDSHFEIPECTVSKDLISCVNPEKKVCYDTAINDCPVCYCSDHEYENWPQLNDVWVKDYQYWSEVAQKWKHLNKNNKENN